MARSPDSRALVYTKTTGGATNLWALPIGGGGSQPKQLSDWKSGQTFWFN